MFHNRLYADQKVVRLLKFFVSLCLLVQISGCAVMSKADCEDGHWQRIGHKVGSSGDRDKQAAFDKRADICAKYDRVADQAAFDRGHQEGFEKYCDIPSAVELGSRGVSPAKSIDICPEFDYPGFASAYQAGYKLHQLNRRVQQTQVEIDSLESDIYRYQRERSQLGYDLRSGELSDQQIQYAKSRIQQLRRDIRSVQQGVYYHQNGILEFQREADAYARLLDVEYGDGRPEY